ncbi:nickel transporter permease [Arvimicrobium flavum]|uniref:nickel transporter permease n=1 Tax=Arvimicrobium flavum TaxID=3393320 RepID=UPI00237B0BD0|nr:nickel transporter permease [Mesorhizobium shangrilense]
MRAASTWIEWLTTETPENRLQGRLAQSYQTITRFARNPLAMVGLAIMLALVTVAALAPWFAPYDPLATNLGSRLLPPSAEHWFGTDHLGRDILSRVIAGSRATLAIVILVAILIGPIGMSIGIVAGYFGGKLDRTLMGVTDVVMAFPRLILALAFVAVLGPGLENAVIAIAITGWPAYARLARAETLSLRQREFVIAAQLQGASAGRILVRYIAPFCVPSVIIRLTLDMAGIILIAAGLGFLGLGAQPPMAEWGAMVAAGRDYLIDKWWVATLPGLAIFVVSLGFNLLGDGLRDVFDRRTA